MDLKNLQLFLRVVALGAIGKAGEELDLSATNASKRIHSLESELGTKLFHRTTRSVTLTFEGEQFLIHARRILDELESIQNQFTNKDNDINGTVRLAVSSSFGRSHIVPFVPELLNQYPDLNLEINFSDGLIDIVEEGFDLAFRIGDLAPSSLLARRIDDNPMVMVATPSYIERWGEPMRPKDLSNHQCLFLGRTKSWQLTGPNNEHYNVPVKSRVQVNFGDAIGEWVKADMGIAQASLWGAGNDIRSGKLKIVLSDFKPHKEIKIWSVRPPGRVMPARVKVVLDFFERRIQETNKKLYNDLKKKC